MTEGSKKRIHRDAKAQFAPAQSGGENDGVASAKPRVITGSDDATVHKWPPGTDNPPAERQVDSNEPSKKSKRGD